MGTRADFYVGRGPEAEWLGSVAWDGHPENFEAIRKTRTVKAFRRAVAKELSGRDDATLPEMGWPWPWNDSRTTDYSYAFDKGRVFRTEYGESYEAGKIWLPEGARPRLDDDGYITNASRYERCVFPDMSARKSATMGARSGLLVLRA